MEVSPIWQAPARVQNKQVESVPLAPILKVSNCGIDEVIDAVV
jgi:hypothetical protein